MRLPVSTLQGVQKEVLAELSTGDPDYALSALHLDALTRISGALDRIADALDPTH